MGQLKAQLKINKMKKKKLQTQTKELFPRVVNRVTIVKVILL